MSVIDDIKARIDILDLVSETVKLRHSGKNYTGFCPFHANSRTPAFAVFPDSGTWRCFGQCNEGGDIFKYIMKREGLDFSGALHFLADRAGIQLHTYTPEQEEQAEAHERLRTLLEQAATYFRMQLLQTPAGGQALAYLRQRGLKDETIEAFGLGYAPRGWDNLRRFLLSKDYTVEEMLQAGVLSEREGGEPYDKFRHRIMFPIRDGQGKLTGFGGRILDKDDVPKFLNSPQTVLFDKGGLLYGLDLARKAIRAADQVVIVEGYLDVIALHQGGYANTVSPMGTALTEDQLRLIKKLTRRIVLALDPDAAGEKATLRGLQVARQAMDRTDEVTFDARGLVRHEARLQADLRVTTLPSGQDPDEVVNADPAAWGKIVADAKPVVIHVMETLAQGRDLDDPKTKSDLAAQVLPLIEDVADAVERDAYRQRLARLLKIDERALAVRSGAPAARQRPVHRPQQAPAAGALRPAEAAAPDVLDRYCLAILIRYPELLYQADAALKKAGLREIMAEDFELTDYQIIFSVIRESLRQEDMEPHHHLQTAMPETLLELSHQLMVQPIPERTTDEDLLEDVVRAVLRMRSRYASRSINQIRFLMEEVNGDMEQMAEYQKSALECARLRDRLDRAIRKTQHL
ncbi:MAG TPA: DNA primase [Anaerolineaceae bacterium]|nr:DNA primase [Anaerolineaceae bacterium]HPN53121.1 DNA primase [Anaerolineaceae bacterium]